VSDLVKKINFPQTSIVKDENIRRYARKLTRVLDDLKRLLDMNLEQNITNITNIISELDHGSLLGLQDVEDHLYAFLVDGTRKFTGHGDGFSNDTALADADPYAAVSEYAIKAYVDALLAYILASPIGSIIYVWKDWEGEKYLERLLPGELGEVLHTGGANQRPYWALVPGFGAEIDIRVWMDAYVKECSIITMDVEKTVIPSGLTSIQRDNFDDLDYFVEYKPEMDAVLLSASIIAMDVTKQIEASMTSSMYALPVI